TSDKRPRRAACIPSQIRLVWMARQVISRFSRDQCMSSAEDLLAEAEAQSASIWGHQSGAPLDAVGRDYVRYRRAFDSFIDSGQAEQAARFVAALRDYWCARAQYDESMTWIERVLRLVELSPQGRSMVLDHAGAIAFRQEKYASARWYFKASVDLRRNSGSTRSLALSLTHLAAVVRWGSGDGIGAATIYEESFTLAEKAGDRLLMGAALMPLGTFALDRGALDEAQVLLRKGLAMYLEVHLPAALPLALEQFAAL